jgi:hypothetical protein
MSEHQIVAFRAIDGPVGEKNLEYMEQQSSRAEITPWSFDNEYHFGDFRGNADEMLRRGYDLHLHYANFGIRKLMIRLPNGLPNAKAAKPYLEEDSLQFLKDKNGPGGILCIKPCHEPGDLENLWEIDDLLDRLIPLRAEILDGDLRPLYLAHLAIATDSGHAPEETKEGPVPAGLNKLTNAQQALAELYELSDSFIAAAARNCPPMIGANDPAKLHLEWLGRQPAATKDRWLAELLGDPNSTVRREMLADFRKSTPAPSWPTIRLDRTIAELEAAATGIHQKATQKAAEIAARQRAKKLAEMKEDPAPTLQETEKLVAQRSEDYYRQAARLLSDLREALAGTPQADLAEKQASNLKNKNPTLRKLTSELRKQGFIPK